MGLGWSGQIRSDVAGSVLTPTGLVGTGLATLGMILPFLGWSDSDEILSGVAKYDLASPGLV